VSSPQDSAASFRREAEKLGLDVSRETLERLAVFAETLQRWQEAINLVSQKSLGDLWSRHILDSAQLGLYVPSVAEKAVDLGSGAGLPGLILAAMRPHLAVTLIDSDARKSAFLSEAARRMGLDRVSVVTNRVDAAPPAQADVVTARALAPLSQLLAWAARHRSDTGICVFHKGKDWRIEVTGAMKDWDIPYQSFTSVTDRDAVILRIGPYAPADFRRRQPEGRRRQDHDRD
jgi:16S rRNA (guanine527-N7)-methyltransferase